MPSTGDARILTLCALLTMCFVCTWAAPCSGPECYRDLYEPDEHDTLWLNVISALRFLFNDNTGSNQAGDQSAENIPEKKLWKPHSRFLRIGRGSSPNFEPEKRMWHPYSRFVRIGRSSGSEFVPGTEKRNYVRIGKIPSSAFRHFQGGSGTANVGSGIRRLNKSGVIIAG